MKKKWNENIKLKLSMVHWRWVKLWLKLNLSRRSLKRHPRGDHENQEPMVWHAHKFGYVTNDSKRSVSISIHSVPRLSLGTLHTSYVIHHQTYSHILSNYCNKTLQKTAEIKATSYFCDSCVQFQHDNGKIKQAYPLLKHIHTLNIISKSHFHKSHWNITQYTYKYKFQKLHI